MNQREQRLQQQGVSIQAAEERVAQQQQDLEAALAALQQREAQLDARMQACFAFLIHAVCNTCIVIFMLYCFLLLQDWSQQRATTEEANRARDAELAALQSIIAATRLQQEQQDKACCCILFLLDYVIAAILLDDRSFGAIAHLRPACLSNWCSLVHHINALGDIAFT